MNEDERELADLATVNAHLDDFVGIRVWSAETNLQLERIDHLLESALRPERAYPHVHVGGTSGKGTVAASVAALSSALGMRVGLHVSPYVQALNETWQIDGLNAKPSAILRVVQHLLDLVTSRPSPYGPPSYFELKVAVAFELFRTLRVDLAVIEVGLGGTLDATNVLGPGVKILTNVGLDHTEVLGDTVEKIASDKIGIFKPGSQVITGATQPTVRQLIRERCHDLGISVWMVGDELRASRTPAGRLAIQMDGFAPVELDVPADWPAHRQTGAVLATAGAALRLDRDIEPDTSSRALASVHLPGRAEMVRRGTTSTILDGAHNEDKLTAALGGIRRMVGDKKTVGVVALKSDKDAASLIDVLWSHLDEIIFTTFHAPPWTCVPPEELAGIARRASQRRVFVEQDPVEAVAAAEVLAGDSGTVVVTGSFYLVGNVRHLWIPDREAVLRGGSYDITDRD